MPAVCHQEPEFAALTEDDPILVDGGRTEAAGAFERADALAEQVVDPVPAVAGPYRIGQGPAGRLAVSSRAVAADDLDARMLA